MMDDSIDYLIRSLYTELERLSEIYDEILDTDVRESIHLTLNYFFVWGGELDRLPIAYGMLSLEADRAVANAVNRFLTSVFAMPELSGIAVGKDRLKRLQNIEISTPKGYQYDRFIGHSDEPLPAHSLPEDLFDEDEYDE